MINETIQMRQLASGNPVLMSVVHFKGSDASAPSVYIQSCVHGAEVQGYWVSMLLIEHFAQHPPLGDVTIVPLANPYGTDCKIGEYTLGRFDPAGGYNWNRNYLDLTKFVEDFMGQHSKAGGQNKFAELIPMFKTFLQAKVAEAMKKPDGYHEKLALQLQNMAVQADIVLDLHCAGVSVPFLFSPSYAMDSARTLDFPFIIEIPDARFGGAMDEAIFCPWVRLTELYNVLHPDQPIARPPVDSFTLELGNKEVIDQELARGQCRNILSYLVGRGVTTRDVLHLPTSLNEFDSSSDVEQVYSCKWTNFVRINAPVGGLVVHWAECGKVIKAGEPLMTISSPAVLQPQVGTLARAAMAEITSSSMHHVTLPIDSILLYRTSTSIVHEGMWVIYAMTDYSVTSTA